MSRVKISVIIPVYNVVAYLEQCVESVLNQTCREIEIILVDDGSTDGSGMLCDVYALKDQRVKVIHQQNQGLSCARNAGIRAACGDYILFVDSDDYIETESCTRFLTVLDTGDYDLVRAKSFVTGPQGDEPKSTPKTDSTISFTGAEFMYRAMKKGNMRMCVPYSLYKRAFILDNDLWFEPGLLHEDELWTPQALLASGKICAWNYYFYHHREREGSICRSGWNERRYNSYMTVCRKLYPLYCRQPQKYRVQFLNYLCMLYMHALNQSRKTDGDKKFIWTTAHSLKNRIKALIYCVSPQLYFVVNPNNKRFNRSVE